MPEQPQWPKWSPFEAVAPILFRVCREIHEYESVKILDSLFANRSWGLHSRVASWL
jgi:hypothetical protein